MAPATYDSPLRLENEARFKKFYYSGEPETTPNHPLQTFNLRGLERGFNDEGKLSVFLDRGVTAPGEMLIVENTVVSCACIRGCSPHTEIPSTKTPTTVPSDRIPLKAHKHLAIKFARLIVDLEAASNPKDEVLLESIFLLDARPLNVQTGMNRGSRKDNQGPWNKVKKVRGRKQRSGLDKDRVWNIIANHAICFKVRSKTREQPSQVETCEFWGMWITAPFISHSCAPNCHAMRVGDAIIIRAAKAIRAGEDLTVPYFDIFQPLCKRELAAQKWGFRCDCIRCTTDPVLEDLYYNIQKEIMSLERQIQMSVALKDAGARRKVVDRLLEKLINLHRTSVEPIVKAYTQECAYNINNQDGETFTADDEWALNNPVRCILASFSEPLIAFYASALQNAYESPLLPDIPAKAKRAERFRELIICVKQIIEVLTPIHPGNLLCEEFCSILLKARNDLIDDDLDEKFTGDIDSQEWYATWANDMSRSYYGPNVKVFESLKYGRMATDL